MADLWVGVLGLTSSLGNILDTLIGHVSDLEGGCGLEGASEGASCD